MCHVHNSPKLSILACTRGSFHGSGRLSADPHSDRMVTSGRYGRTILALPHYSRDRAGSRYFGSQRAISSLSPRRERGEGALAAGGCRWQSWTSRSASEHPRIRTSTCSPHPRPLSPEERRDTLGSSKTSAIRLTSVAWWRIVLQAERARVLFGNIRTFTAQNDPFRSAKPCCPAKDKVCTGSELEGSFPIPAPARLSPGRLSGSRRCSLPGQGCPGRRTPRRPRNRSCGSTA